MKRHAMFCGLLGLSLLPLGGLRADGLGRTWEKLSREKALTVGYFGGSITEGAGASDASKTSWRGLTTAWLRQTFPEAAIREINAGVGGTGSDFGAFRCKRDLLDKKPDLIFLEFAVNDSGAPDARAPYYEGIVRQILRANPSADIIAVYTVNKASDTYPQGAPPPAVASEQKIAAHYGLGEINVGQKLSEAIQTGQGSWETLTKDATHPSDNGYRIYGDTVIAFLESHRADKAGPPAPMPLPLHAGAVENAAMIDAWTAEAPGWTKEEISLSGRFPHRISAETPGAELTLSFKGTTLGVLWEVSPDSGEIIYSIDGGPEKRRTVWDKYALQFTRATTFMLAKNLRDTEHILKLKISDQRPQQSTGTSVRIGAFLVH